MKAPPKGGIDKLVDAKHSLVVATGINNGIDL
jgi:hypothetical protein